MTSATLSTTALTVRPSATCELGTQPNQTFDDCVYRDSPSNSITFRWPNFYTGIHEGLTLRDVSAHYTHTTSIGHLLASSPSTGPTGNSALLDFCIRRGYDVSCRNAVNVTVLRRAIDYVVNCGLRDPITLHFMQVLADAHALFDTSTNDTADLIRNYIGEDKDTSMDASDVALLNQIAELFDQRV
jgi:hypothetical protein